MVEESKGEFETVSEECPKLSIESVLDDWPKLTIDDKGCNFVGYLEFINTSDDIGEINCPICLRKLSELCINCAVVMSSNNDCIVLESCNIGGHMYHKHCIDKFLASHPRKCPMCSESLAEDPTVVKFEV